jgi:syntaxin 5
MKESKDRTEQFMYSTAAAASQAPPSSSIFQSLQDKANLAHKFDYFSSDSLLLGSQSSANGNGNPYKPDVKGKGRAQDSDVLALDIGAAEEGTAQNGGQFMQMQLVEQQVRPPLFNQPTVV